MTQTVYRTIVECLYDAVRNSLENGFQFPVSAPKQCAMSHSLECQGVLGRVLHTGGSSYILLKRLGPCNSLLFTRLMITVQQKALKTPWRRD
jgi:hypothetical protein